MPVESLEKRFYLQKQRRQAARIGDYAHAIGKAFSQPGREREGVPGRLNRISETNKYVNMFTVWKLVVVGLWFPYGV